MRQYRIASIPADGIGPEVISAGLEVLDAVAARDGAFSLTIDHYDWGSDRYRKHGAFMPPDGLAWLRTADAIYFGAVGDPNIPDHVSLWGLRLQICQGLDQYANVRPVRDSARREQATAQVGQAISIGSSFARKPRASTPATADGHIAAFPTKSPPRSPSSPVPASSALAGRVRHRPVATGRN